MSDKTVYKFGVVALVIVAVCLALMVSELQQRIEVYENKANSRYSEAYDDFMESSDECLSDPNCVVGIIPFETLKQLCPPQADSEYCSAYEQTARLFIDRQGAYLDYKCALTRILGSPFCNDFYDSFPEWNYGGYKEPNPVEECFCPVCITEIILNSTNQSCAGELE